MRNAEAFEDFRIIVRIFVAQIPNFRETFFIYQRTSECRLNSKKIYRHRCRLHSNTEWFSWDTNVHRTPKWFLFCSHLHTKYMTNQSILICSMLVCKICIAIKMWRDCRICNFYIHLYYHRPIYLVDGYLCLSLSLFRFFHVFA